MMQNIINKFKSLLGRNSKRDLKSKFTEIHDKNLFFGVESISGTGSDLLQTEKISIEIPKLLSKYKVQTFIDAPCGDLYWMQHVDFNEVKYIGLDIVEELIKKNNQKFSNDTHSFFCKNIVSDVLPKGDVIFIRDCWVHLSDEDILKCVMNLKRCEIKYLLTTSFSELKLNESLTKIWRPLNLELAPFKFPQPIEVVNEGCTENEGKYKDKCLMMWNISSLPDFQI